MIPLLILALAVTAPCSQILSLHTGHEIVVCGPVQTAGAQTIFNGEDGKLYSLPSNEIAGLRATRQAETSELDSPGQEGTTRPLSVSETEKARLLERLARSRGIRAATPVQQPVHTEESDREIEVSGGSDEREWRQRSRAVDERVRQAHEELDLLIRRAQKLEDELLSLRAMGFKDRQFGYQILQLQHTRDSMDGARLEIVRAEREQFQFREDARKEGILPGWLR